MFRFAFFACALILLTLVCVSCSNGPAGSGFASTSNSNEVLYVIESGAITTYGIDPNSLAITQIGQPVEVPSLQSLLQFVPSPDGRFLYLLSLGTTNTNRLSVYATDSYGVPQTPPIQTLDANYLFQLNFHPSGKFVYALQVDSSNGQYGSSSGAVYTAYIRMFRVNKMSGFLQENIATLGTYGPSLDWPISLYGVSSDGNRVFLNNQATEGSAFLVRMVNNDTGALGPDINLFGQTGAWQTMNQLAIGDKLLVDLRQIDNGTGYINIYANPPGNSAPLIHCAASMLSLCETSSNIQLDPSGGYIFLTDPTSMQISASKIDLPGHQIRATGSLLPPTEATPGFFFSPDGKLIYATAAADGDLHVYSFDPVTGQIVSSSSALPLPPGNVALCPSTRD